MISFGHFHQGEDGLFQAVELRKGILPREQIVGNVFKNRTQVCRCLLGIRTQYFMLYRFPECRRTPSVRG